MVTDECCFLSLHDISLRIHARDLSPVEVVEAHLARIEKINPLINAFISLCPEEALAEAKKAEEEISGGHYRGPLHGIPFGAKDIFDTAGILTTNGSRMFRENVPSEDAESIRRLKDSGAILIGKCNTHAFAGGTVNNCDSGPTRNPWNRDYIPGGSSSGSGAGVSAFLCPAATGTDTGGSIRGPASLCGTMGLKPTHGRVSIRGVFPHATSLDHVGPFARTARDCGIFLQGMAGYDPLDPTSRDVPVPDFCAEVERGIQGMRIALCADLIRVELDESVEKAFEESVEVLRGLGAQMEVVRFPLAERIQNAFWTIIAAEFHEVHAERMAENRDGYNEDLQNHFDNGSKVTLDEYVRALRDRKMIRRVASDIFRSIDILVMPAYPCPAAPIKTNLARINGVDREWYSVGLVLTPPHNMTGFPAMAVPIGLNSEGLPLAMQIVGPPWGEARVLRVAHAYEQATPEIRSLRPPLD